MRLQRDANPKAVSVLYIVKLNTLLVQLRAQRIEASSEVISDPNSLYQYANNPLNTTVPADPHKIFLRLDCKRTEQVNTTSSLVLVHDPPSFFCTEYSIHGTADSLL
jgi:hypothetical protein